MRFRMVAAAAFILMSTTTAWADTDTVRLCINLKNGEIRLLAGHACHASERLVVWNMRGPQGPAGPQGPVGPQGPQGAQGIQGPAGATTVVTTYGTNPLTLVDQNDQEIGVVTDPVNGAVLRHVGDDSVVIYATANGPVTGPLTFYHASADCKDDRYVGIPGQSGFAYAAAVHGGAVLYTKTDQSVAPTVDVQAYEQIDAKQDAMQPGTCLPLVFSSQLGVVTAVSDPALANLKLPLHLK